MGRPKKPELLDRIQQLSRQGQSDSAIGRQLGIHRTTVKRYRELAEKEDVTKQARIQVVREALSKHFADLCQVLEKMEDELRTPPPEYAGVDERAAPGLYSCGYAGGTTGLSWRIFEGGGMELRIPVEEEVLYSCLMQHTRRFEFWSLLQEWKEMGGQYLLELSKLRRLIQSEVEERTGLRIDAMLDEPCLNGLFGHGIYKEACSNAFFGETVWGRIDYEIVTSQPGWFELRLGRTPLAASKSEKELEHCRDVHREMMEEHRSTDERTPELIKAVELFGQLRDLEARITPELEKLRLKRTFPGRCDICPD